MTPHRDYKHRLVISFICILFMGPWIAHAFQPITINLKTQAFVAGDEFTLDQIADISDPNSDEKSDISDLVIGSSPLPGQSFRIYSPTIEQKIKQNGMELDRYRIIAKGPVKVQRKFNTLTPQRIKAVVRAHIKKHAPWQIDQMKIRPIGYRRTHKCR